MASPVRPRWVEAAEDLGRRNAEARAEIRKAIAAVRDAGKPRAPAEKKKDDGNFRRKAQRIIRQMQKAKGGK